LIITGKSEELTKLEEKKKEMLTEKDLKIRELNARRKDMSKAF